MNLDFTYRLLSSAKTLPETIKKSRQMLAMSSAPDADAPHELEFTSQAYDTFDLPAQGAVKVHHDLFNHQSGGVRFTRGRKQIALVSTHQPEQAALTALVAAHGVRGLVWIPLAVDEECARLHHRYQAFLDDRAQHIRQLAEERTGDAELQERIAQSVLERIEANLR